MKIKTKLARLAAKQSVFRRMVSHVTANATYPKFKAHYGDFRFDEDYRHLEVAVAKESGAIRGEIIHAVRSFAGVPKRLLLPGEPGGIKQTYSDLLGLPAESIVTTGLAPQADVAWNFESDPPAMGRFDLIISQAMIEHLLDPYKHVRDCYAMLEPGGTLVLHTVMPGFGYHRYPIDCVRFFPDWFEEVAKRVGAEIVDKYIGASRIMYTYRKPPKSTAGSA